MSELVEKNSFQQSHWPQIKNVNQLNGFVQFQEHCPFTTKDMLAKDRIDNPPYGSNLTYPLNHYTRFHQTSGTLGVPMTWLDTPGDWQWMLRNWDLVLENAGVQKGEKCFFAVDGYRGTAPALKTRESVGVLGHARVKNASGMYVTSPRQGRG